METTVTDSGRDAAKASCTRVGYTDIWDSRTSGTRPEGNAQDVAGAGKRCERMGTVKHMHGEANG